MEIGILPGPIDGSREIGLVKEALNLVQRASSGFAQALRDYSNGRNGRAAAQVDYARPELWQALGKLDRAWHGLNTTEGCKRSDGEPCFDHPVAMMYISHAMADIRGAMRDTDLSHPNSWSVWQRKVHIEHAQNDLAHVKNDLEHAIFDISDYMLGRNKFFVVVRNITWLSLGDPCLTADDENYDKDVICTDELECEKGLCIDPSVLEDVEDYVYDEKTDPPQPQELDAEAPQDDGAESSGAMWAAVAVATFVASFII